MKKKIFNQTGQLILALVLIMTVALAIGLSIVQKSLVDISTSTKVEQSSRAFSAAEAGVEKALKINDCGVNGANCGVDFTNINNSSATINDSTRIPYIPAPNARQDPFEYPPISKEDVAQVWLADLDSTTNPPAGVYTQNSLDVYWGGSSSEKTAIEVTLVYYDTTQSKYVPRKWYLDNDSATRTGSRSNFILVSCGGLPAPMQAYQCKYTLGNTSDPNGVLLANLILLRARLLYNTTPQPFAVQAVGVRGVGTCNPSGCWLPPQARNIISTGVAGETQRRVKLFQINKVVPPYFDYAIFSAGKIEK